MSLDALIMFSGALVALLPFLGFPNSWDAVLLLILGLFITFLGVVVRRRRKKMPRAERVERTEMANIVPSAPLHE